MKQFEKVQAIQERMRTDAGFAQEIKANPKAVFERELGKSLPDGFNQATVESTFPGFFQLEEIKLSEEQMEKIAGGVGKAPGCVPCFG